MQMSERSSRSALTALLDNAKLVDLANENLQPVTSFTLLFPTFNLWSQSLRSLT